VTTIQPPTPPAPWESIRVILRVVLVVVCVAVTLYLIYLLRKPLTWVFIAGFLAIALSGPINFLSRWMKRGFAIAIVYLGVILIPVLIAGIMVPPIVTEANNLIDRAPQYAQDVSDVVSENDTLRRLEEDYNITERLQEEAEKLPNRAGDAATVLSDIGLGVVNSVFAGVTILVLSLFLVGSGRHWLDAMANRQAPDRAEWTKALFDRIGNAVGNYVAGALGQATIAGILSYVVLLVLGVPYAGPLAVIIGLLDLVPLVGSLIGAILVALVTLFEDFPTDTIIWVVWAIVYQQVENNIIQPRIQARAVQVHPFVVLVSVLFGSTLFGVLGALLAIPIAATIQILIREYMAFRRAATAGLQPVPPSPSPSDA
jgi:predicted PurR-regulated permease PerM